MSEETKEPDLRKPEEPKYIMNDPIIHHIIMFYKEEFKRNLSAALKPFMDRITMPIDINIVLGEHLAKKDTK